MEIVENERVKRWTDAVGALSAKVGGRILIRCFAYLNGLDKSRGLNPDQICTYQKELNRIRENEYELFDILEKWRALNPIWIRISID